MKKTLLTLCALVGLYSGAKAITKAEADSVINARFADKFGTHYSQNTQVYDGTSFFTATALARSGDTLSGASGYQLVTPSIAVTTENPDTAGARANDCATLKLDYANIPTISAAQDSVENFLEQVIEGPAGVEGEPTSLANKYIKTIKTQNPNNGKNFNVFSDGNEKLNNIEMKVYNIAGQYAGTAYINNGQATTNDKLANGKYFGVIPMNIGGKIHFIKTDFIVNH